MADYVKALFGENAVHVPAWMYVQNHGDGLVSFVGASRLFNSGTRHPLRFGSERTHQLVNGSIIVQPRDVVGTDVLRGQGLGSLATTDPDIERFLEQGEYIIGR